MISIGALYAFGVIVFVAFSLFWAVCFRRVNRLVRQAEIKKDEHIVAAEQDKTTRVIMADGQLESKRK